MARLLLVLSLGLLAGCATRLLPPETARAPQAAYLLDHGRHASLVLPYEAGLVRYSDGERQWYLLGRQGVLEGIAALLWPTPAVLGRRHHPGLVLPEGWIFWPPKGWWASIP